MNKTLRRKRAHPNPQDFEAPFDLLLDDDGLDLDDRFGDWHQDAGWHRLQADAQDETQRRLERRRQRRAMRRDRQDNDREHGGKHRWN